MRAAIVLFTRDLRVHDQAALFEAGRAAETVVPLFVFDERLLRAAGPPRLAFLQQALADLRRSLRQRGSELVVRRGDPVRETVRLARAVGASAIIVGDDSSPYAQLRRARLERACRRARLALRVENTTAAVPPAELCPADRDHYRVFTPYWRRWRAEPLGDVLRAPDRLVLPAGIEPGDLEAPTHAEGERFPGGETEGRRRLGRWLSDGLSGYERARDDLSEGATSGLSAYLHFGCLSAREVVTQARDRDGGAEPFVRQLCWRDFYGQLLAANPSSATEDLHARGREWNDDEEAFERWREGRTGCAIVDAAMRELHAEGWMPNRARLIVSAYLTRTLRVDWRCGAEVFSDLLVDADIANNVGNWQWVAGTGVDTRFNRGFNAAAQARRFDPDGAYVRRHAPEAYLAAST